MLILSHRAYLTTGIISCFYLMVQQNPSKIVSLLPLPLPLLLLLLLLLPLQQADLLDKKRPNDISEQDKNQTARTSSTVRYGFLSS